MGTIQSIIDRKWVADFLRKCRSSLQNQDVTDVSIHVYLVINQAFKNQAQKEAKSKGLQITKVTMANIDDMVCDAIYNYEVASTAVCPALPCGADDHWYEQHEMAVQETKEELLNLLSWKHNQIRKGKHVPNIHAFDEYYFGDNE